ncbi:hypothetical protein, partial [Sphingomonas mali]|uniref:hypothetical protein n=1 Tax=Sphingomonas mali TaxID=40682 RepID=UPI001C3FC9CB
GGGIQYVETQALTTAASGISANTNGNTFTVQFLFVQQPCSLLKMRSRSRSFQKMNGKVFLWGGNIFDLRGTRIKFSRVVAGPSTCLFNGRTNPPRPADWQTI